MKTSELTGAALDWAVAKAEGEDYSPTATTNGIGMEFEATNYSTEWSQAGPIIEREVPMLMRTNGGDWIAQGSYDTANDKEAQRYYGPTPLVAAMRCYVASKLGDDVDVPEELL
jgi:hypothetical protein